MQRTAGLTWILGGRCQEKAKHHLALSQKPIALSHLRSKRQLEEVLLKRIASAQQLESVLMSIDQAKGDIEIMAAYATSTSTLKSILSHPSLDLDHVERTTEELAEVMANQEEIDSAIRLGGDVAVGASGQTDGVDEDELRKELEELVKLEQQQQQQQQAAKDKDKKKQQADAASSSQADKEKQPATPSAEASQAGTNPLAEAEAEAEAGRRRRYEDAQQRQRDEAARAEVERMHKAERVAAE